MRPTLKRPVCFLQGTPAENRWYLGGSCLFHLASDTGLGKGRKNIMSSSTGPKRGTLSILNQILPNYLEDLTCAAGSRSVPSQPPDVPFFSAVGNPSCRSWGSMEWGNCSRGPVSRLTAYVALFPARAKSTSLNLENHLGGRRAARVLAVGRTSRGPGRGSGHSLPKLLPQCCGERAEKPRGVATA